MRARRVVRVPRGFSPEIGRLDAEGAATRARATLAVLAERLNLRQEFLQRGTPADSLARKLDELQLKQDLMIVQAELAAARARLAVVERQRSFGTASDVELLRAQLSVKETELDLQRLGLQLQARKAPDPR